MAAFHREARGFLGNLSPEMRNFYDEWPPKRIVRDRGRAGQGGGITGTTDAIVTLIGAIPITTLSGVVLVIEL